MKFRYEIEYYNQHGTATRTVQAFAPSIEAAERAVGLVADDPTSRYAGSMIEWEPRNDDGTYFINH